MILEKLVGGPLDFLKTEQELTAAKITKARSIDLMKAAKLHFLGKKTKIARFARFRQPVYVKIYIKQYGPPAFGGKAIFIPLLDYLFRRFGCGAGTVLGPS